MDHLELVFQLLVSPIQHVLKHCCVHTIYTYMYIHMHNNNNLVLFLVNFSFDHKKSFYLLC